MQGEQPMCPPQTEVTNWTLTTLVRSLVSKSLRDWDPKLPHAEFAYNKSPYATKHSPFKWLSKLLETRLISRLKSSTCKLNLASFSTNAGDGCTTPAAPELKKHPFDTEKTKGRTVMRLVKRRFP